MRRPLRASRGIPGFRARRETRAHQASRGPKGDPGGVSGYAIVTQITPLAADGYAHAMVDCPGRKKAVGGGYSTGVFLTTTQSVPLANGAGWDVYAHNTESTAKSLSVWAICANTV